MKHYDPKKKVYSWWIRLDASPTNILQHILNNRCSDYMRFFRFRVNLKRQNCLIFQRRHCELPRFPDSNEASSPAEMCSQIQDLLHSIPAPSARATSRVEESATCATAVLAGCIRSVLISKMLDSTKGRKIGHARPAVPPLLHHPHNHLQLQQRPASPRMTRSTSYSSTRTELVTSYQSWNAFWRNIT